MPNLLITCGHLIRHRARFEAELAGKGVNAFFPELSGQQFSAPEMVRLIAGQDIVIAGDDFIDRAVFEAGKADRLKAVIKWGIGVDAIDREAARATGIPLYNTPGAFSDEVADVALGYVLMLARRLHEMHESVKAGGWKKVEGISLRGQTAGVVGLGAIGRAVATRCSAFGMTVIGYDAFPIPAEVLGPTGAVQTDLDRVLAQADFLILACALTPESHHLMNASAFGRMKAGAHLVNVARGPIVDEAALVEALGAGRLAAAALDVYEEEPLPAASPLRRFDNVVFGTHNGSNTRQAVDRINRLTIDLALDLFGLSGEPPRLKPLIAA